LFLLM